MCKTGFMQTIRVAAVIFHSPRNQVIENLARMEVWVAAAHREGAAIVCFPEMNITGYGVDAGIRDSAELLPGEIGAHLCALAVRHQIVILAGAAEKGEAGGTFASHMVAAPDGCRGVYRKLHIAPPEKAVFTAGPGIPVFEAAGIRFGIQLCYDAHFPELSTRMALDGADVIFMPHASPRGTPAGKLDSWLRHLPARAFDNGVFVVACNQTGTNGAGSTFPGVALAIGPDGRLIATDVSDREGLLIATLNAERLGAVRTHPMRYFLPHRRPDLFPPTR
jgi:N-carbamoylputrescine amidase